MRSFLGIDEQDSAVGPGERSWRTGRDLHGTVRDGRREESESRDVAALFHRDRQYGIRLASQSIFNCRVSRESTRSSEAWVDTVLARPTLARLILSHAAEADEHGTAEKVLREATVPMLIVKRPPAAANAGNHV